MDLNRLNGVGRYESEDAGIEIKFQFETAFDIFGDAKAMLFFFKGNVGHWNPFGF